MTVYTKPGKQLGNTILYNVICIEAILLSKQGLGAFRIGLRCLHVKQNGTDCTGFIFVPPADAEQSCTGLLEQSVSDSCRAVLTQPQSNMKSDPIRR